MRLLSGSPSMIIERAVLNLVATLYFRTILIRFGIIFQSQIRENLYKSWKNANRSLTEFWTQDRDSLSLHNYVSCWNREFGIDMQ